MKQESPPLVGGVVQDQGEKGILPKTDVLPNFESMNGFVKQFVD